MMVIEAAKYMKMPYSELIVLVRNKVIPSYKIGNNYMLSKVDIDKWIEYQNNIKINKNENETTVC